MNKTYSIKAIIGGRLQKARKSFGLTRQELADRLSQNKKAPSPEMTMERLKQWEYGNNAIAIDWIPAICDELSIDVGYLFGEYSEHKRVAADIVKETGIRESAITHLQYIRDIQPEYMEVLSVLIERGDLEYLLYLLYKRFQMLPANAVKPIIEKENGEWHMRNAREFTEFCKAREIDIPFEGGILHTQKTNLLDSLISSVVVGRLEIMAKEYQKGKGEQNGQHQTE